MTRRRLKHLAGLLIPLLMASCSEGDIGRSAVVGADGPLKQAPITALAIPPIGIDRDLSDLPRSSADAMRALTPNQRRLVGEFYDQFGTTVFSFTSQEQLDWMLRHGYPMPEDILKANALTTEDLLARYEAGDTKAGFFYLARVSDEVDVEAFTSEDLHRLEMMAISLLESGSPFAGYSYFEYSLNVRRNVPAALAGLSWAEASGDMRAGLEMLEMAATIDRTNPGSLDPASLLVEYRKLESSIALKRPDLLSRRRELFPH